MKKTILVDLDGVLNEYNGNYDENNIPPVKSGAEKFLKELCENFIVKIFTTRDLYKAQEWFLGNNLNKYISGITAQKEPVYLIIDDRCINFNGDYEKTIEKIKNFKVWYK